MLLSVLIRRSHAVVFSLTWRLTNLASPLPLPCDIASPVNDLECDEAHTISGGLRTRLRDATLGYPYLDFAIENARSEVLDAL